MPQPIFNGQINGPSAEAVTFSVADNRDEVEIQQLLKRCPPEGKKTLVAEYGPDCFSAAKAQAGAQKTIVARYDGKIVGVGRCSVRRRFFNREPRRVGYLEGVRLAPEFAGRVDILRKGYAFFHGLSWPEPPDFYFSSVAKGNLRERQFLERNLSGMPRHRFTGDFVTAVISVPGKTSGPESHQGISDPEELAGWLNHHNAHYQMAPCWTATELVSLRTLGLKLENFVVTREEGHLTTAAAIWDQRSFRQTIVRNSGHKFALLQPILDRLIALRGFPMLPPSGSALSQAYISHLAIDPEQPGLLAGVVRSLFPIARREGLQFLTLGFMEGDRRLTVLRRNFPCREYRNKIYFVSWGDLLYQPKGLLPSPEVGLL